MESCLEWLGEGNSGQRVCRDRLTPNDPSSGNRTITALTGLRGVAALWVVLYHLTKAGYPVVDRGYLGVDVFFILSGYVLSYVYAPRLDLTDFSSYLHFLKVRLARIYPLHAITLGILGLLVAAMPRYVEHDPLGYQRYGVDAFIATALLVQNWGYFLPTCWNTPAWSLSAEWFAYLAFPAFLAVTQWPRSVWMPLLVAFCLYIGYCGVLLLRGVPDFDVHGTPGMLRMATEFAAGCLLYRAFANHLRNLPAVFDMVAAALMLAIFVFPIAAYLAVPVFALIVLLAAQEGGKTARILSLPIVVYLGQISYSLYLIHWPVMQMSYWFLVGPDAGPPLLMFTVGMFALLTCLALASASFRWIELPTRAWGRRIAGAPIRRAMPSRPDGNP